MHLKKDADKVLATCFDKYLIDVETTILSKSLDSCDNLIKGGYDKKFSVYEKSVISQISYQVYKYIGGAQKTRFFKYTETRNVKCYKDYSSAQAY
jgi:hypothetical protein